MSKTIPQILHEAKQQVLSGRLGAALTRLHEVYDAKPGLHGRETFDTLCQDHSLMLNFLLRGFPDAQREPLYAKLLDRTYALVANLETLWRCKNVGIFADAFRHAKGINPSPTLVQEVLERFVSDEAMLSLEANEETAREKRHALHDRHQAFMDGLFCSLFTALQWSTEEAQTMARIILLPTISLQDALLMVSGVSMSAMNEFDLRKLQLLGTVYQEAHEPALRQRALVGLVLSLGDRTSLFAERTEGLLNALAANEQFESGLADMQKQIFYCLNAERDHETIEKDIMPTIIKNSNLKVTRFGIEEKEEDALENLLHPDAEDKAMEAVEEGILKMNRMMEAGSDINFGGFSQMKRFPFFATFSNWLTPYYAEHPGIREAREKLGSGDFLGAMLRHGDFCESDKFSFLLGMAHIFERVSKNMRETLRNGAAFEFPDGMDADEFFAKVRRDEDALSRRLYLQDLYRIFRLYAPAKDLWNPFAETKEASALFLTGAFFKRFTAAKMSVSRFLRRKSCPVLLGRLLGSFSSEDPEYAMLSGWYGLQMKEYELAAMSFHRVLSLIAEQQALSAEVDLQATSTDADQRQALRGLATALMRLERFAEAAEAYGKLLTLQPDNVGLTLNRCVALLESGGEAEAVELLFKLHYLQPDDVNVRRALAWGLLALGRFEQAGRHHEMLLSGKPSAADWLNAGYSAWALGHVSEAQERFQTYVRMCGEAETADGKAETADSETSMPDGETLLLDAFERDGRVVERLGLSAIDLRLMAESLKFEI